MHRPRLLFGALQPGSTAPFLLYPTNPEGLAGGGQVPPVQPPPAAPPVPVFQPPAVAPPAVPAQPDPTRDGYQANTPLEQMTVEQQRNYWQAYARKHEGNNRELAGWKRDNEAKVAAHDRLVAASATEQDKAVEAAKAEAVKAGRAEMVPQLVAAEFLAAAAGKLTREQVTQILAPLNQTYFLAADGTVDTAKVTDYVSKVAGTAPAAGGGANGGHQLPAGFPDLGQGARGGTQVTGKQAGLAEAERRFGKKAEAGAQ